MQIYIEYQNRKAFFDSLSVNVITNYLSTKFQDAFTPVGVRCSLLIIALIILGKHPSCVPPLHVHWNSHRPCVCSTLSDCVAYRIAEPPITEQLSAMARSRFGRYAIPGRGSLTAAAERISPIPSRCWRLCRLGLLRCLGRPCACS